MLRHKYFLIDVVSLCGMNFIAVGCVCVLYTQAAIAKRSDMLVMSTEGPISAFVNEHGYVFEALTLTRARGLMLHGRPETAHSWFPGYAQSGLE